MDPDYFKAICPGRGDQSRWIEAQTAAAEIFGRGRGSTTDVVMGTEPMAGLLEGIEERINPDVLLFLHSDGNLMSILPDLIECGFHAVHPIQPESMDMNLVKKRYGDRLTLFGGVSVQSELPGSDPDSIRTLVRERIDSLGADGGFMLAPSNTILPDVPPASIVAMYREATKTDSGESPF